MIYATEREHVTRQKLAEEQPKLRAVRLLNERLGRLMADPQPTVHAWHEAVRATIYAMSEAIG